MSICKECGAWRCPTCGAVAGQYHDQYRHERELFGKDVAKRLRRERNRGRAS